MWTGWGFNLASKCLIGSCGAESVEPQLVDCSLCLSRNSRTTRRYPWAELTVTAFQIPICSSSFFSNKSSVNCVLLPLVFYSTSFLSVSLKPVKKFWLIDWLSSLLSIGVVRQEHRTRTQQPARTLAAMLPAALAANTSSRDDPLYCPQSTTSIRRLYVRRDRATEPMHCTPTAADASAEHLLSHFTVHISSVVLTLFAATVVLF